MDRFTSLVLRDTVRFFAAWSCRRRLDYTVAALVSVLGQSAERESIEYAEAVGAWGAPFWSSLRWQMETLASRTHCVLIPGAAPILASSWGAAHDIVERYAGAGDELQEVRVAPSAKLLWDTHPSGAYVYPGLVRIFRDRVLLRARKELADEAG